MFQAARRFALYVIAAHLLLLAAVVAVVIVASYNVYISARTHAVDETARRQSLLARQTSAGIEAYYRSIISDLVVLERNEESATRPSTSTAPSSNPATLPSSAPAFPSTARGRGGLGGPGTGGRGRGNRPPLDPNGNLDLRPLADRAVALTPDRTLLMWRMLQNRASIMFVYNPQPPTVPPDATPEDNPLFVQQCFPARSMPAARDFVKLNADFLNSVTKDAAVSQYVSSPEPVGGGHLIAVPATSGGRFGDRVLVAFVPLHNIKTEFFDDLNSEGNVNAALLDRTGTAMIALDDKLTGHNVLDEITDPDPELRALGDAHIRQGEPGTWTAEKPTKFGSTTLPPRIIASDPVELPGRKWTVLIISPLDEVDLAVRPIFRGALFWAIFLSLSITAIFASTSLLLIRSRIRLQRAEKDLLTNELKQAREIQLAWLPDSHSPPPGVAVAATNLPASHISGDFYNWFPLPPASSSLSTSSSSSSSVPTSAPQKVAVCIGDVTGHGMSAAFLMATTQLLVRNTLLRVQDPGACLTEVNKQLCAQVFRGQFVTLLLLVIDPAARTVELATAGHAGPLIAAGDGTREGIDFHPLAVEPQYLLGVVPEAVYPTQHFDLAPGATLLMYTDGLIEASSPDGPQLGITRILTTLRGGFTNLQSVLDTLITAVHTHTRRADLTDDVTLVALQLARPK